MSEVCHSAAGKRGREGALGPGPLPRNTKWARQCGSAYPRSGSRTTVSPSPTVALTMGMGERPLGRIMLTCAGRVLSCRSPEEENTVNMPSAIATNISSAPSASHFTSPSASASHKQVEEGIQLSALLSCKTAKVQECKVVETPPLYPQQPLSLCNLPPAGAGGEVSWDGTLTVSSQEVECSNTQGGGNCGQGSGMDWSKVKEAVEEKTAERKGRDVTYRCLDDSVRPALSTLTAPEGVGGVCLAPSAQATPKGERNNDSLRTHSLPQCSDPLTRPRHPFTRLSVHATNQKPLQQSVHGQREMGTVGAVQSPQVPAVSEKDSERREVNSHLGVKRDALTECGKFRSSLIKEGRALETFPIVGNDNRDPEGVLLDPKGITHLIDCAEKRELKSLLALNALEVLTASGLLFQHVTNLMCMVLKPVQYALWASEWVPFMDRWPD
ncbi:uncharacterized protein LOC128089600 [Tympanuchus pallidicinctus]|uniref:uncharacterized protein LOC128089600 n=1 Tax=Tympanuchus pallidicinctus TaxID=109042 RepID=UPI002286EA96|nr:uncharacterized protein LOC128089600 [Tympanuchus pallidicinctus]XP_052557166.1 uncharacterized protein LOC128089600 [Tympanuchus pallidicinctus]